MAHSQGGDVKLSRIFRRENRSAEGYTNLITQARQEAAEGASLDVETLAVSEICASLYARGFSQAEVSGSGITFLPDLLALIGRGLLTRGEAVLDIRSATDGEPLIASGWEISGGSSDPLAWRYRLTLPTPSGTNTVARRSLDVLHFRINAAPTRPWEGRSPFVIAGTTALLASRIEQSLSDEFKIPVGRILPVPAGLDTDKLDQVRDDMNNAKGKTAVVESMAQGWGDGRSAAPHNDWVPRAMGPKPDEGVLKARSDVADSMYLAAGVPVEITASAEGSATREAWRRFLHGTLQPLGNVIAGELRRKVQGNPRVSFDRLFASDLSGRARAFQSIVAAGLPVERAATLAGLLESE